MSKDIREITYQGVTYKAEITKRTVQGKDGLPYTKFSASIQIGDRILTSSFYQTVKMAITELIPCKI